MALQLWAGVVAARRAAHPEANVDERGSEYDLAGEIARTSEGLTIAVEEQHWQVFAQADRAQCADLLLALAQRVNLKKLRKSPRGPKKPPTPRTKHKHKGKPHVSTAKLLARR